MRKYRAGDLESARSENQTGKIASREAIRKCRPFCRLLSQRRRSARMKKEALHIELGRRYHFSASHRLHNPKLGDEENRRVYGKCNNPYGHGHNYTIEVRVSGQIDRATGMISNLADLDSFVNERVIEP